MDRTVLVFLIVILALAVIFIPGIGFSLSWILWTILSVIVIIIVICIIIWLFREVVAAVK